MCLVQCNHMKINGSWVEGKSKMDCAAWCSNCQVDREGGVSILTSHPHNTLGT